MLDNVAEVVKTAGAGPLAFLALGLLALAYLILQLFARDHVSVKLVVFLLLFGLVCSAPFLVKLVTEQPPGSESRHGNDEGLPSATHAASADQVQTVSNSNSRSAEDAAYLAAVKERRRNTYSTFLARYPSGSRADDIRRRLDQCVENKEVTSPPRNKVVEHHSIHAEFLKFDGSEESFYEELNRFLPTSLCMKEGYDSGTGECTPDTTVFESKSECPMPNKGVCVAGVTSQSRGFKNGKFFFNKVNCSLQCYDHSIIVSPVETCPR